MRRLWCMVFAIAGGLCDVGSLVQANEPGTLILHGGGSMPSAVKDRFIELAGGEAARLVIIPTADPETPLDPSRVESWQRRGVTSVSLLHTGNRAEAESEAFAEPLKRATGVWISGGWQTRLASTYLRTPVERELAALLKRGGVIAGTSAGAAVLSQIMIVRGEIREGFDLVPHAVVDQHFLARNRQDRLWNVLAQHPQRIGIGIDEGTAAVIQGDQLTVIGESTVSMCVAAHGDKPRRMEQFKDGESLNLQPLRTAVAARK